MFGNYIGTMNTCFLQYLERIVRMEAQRVTCCLGVTDDFVTGKY